MRTRITVIFGGEKFDYELKESKETVLNELNNIKSENGFLELIDIYGHYVRITPSRVPVMEIIELEED